MKRDLSALLADHPERERSGDGWAIRCPAHADGRPSLRVAITAEGKLLLKCRAGCAFEEVRRGLGLEDVSLSGWVPGGEVEPIQASTEEPPSAVELAVLQEYLAEAERLLWSDVHGDLARGYARTRWGLTDAHLRQLGLGFDPGGLEAIDFDAATYAWRQVPRLVVPFYGPDGAPHGVQGRALEPGDAVRWCGLRNPPGGRSWGRTAWLDPEVGLDYGIVTEGPGDGLAVYGAGFLSVAVRGAALGASKALRQELARGLRGRKVVVAGDQDEAGRGFTEEVSRALAEEGLEVYALELPEGVGDLSDWRDSDPQGFPKALERAVRAARRVSGPVIPATTPQGPGGASQGLSDAMGDLQVAETLLDRSQGVLFVEGLGFHHWSGTHWLRDAGKNAPVTRALAHRVGKELADEAHEMGDPDTLPQAQQDAQKRLLAVARACQTTLNLDRALKELEALCHLPLERLDAHDHLLAVANGTVDLRTGQLRPSRQEDYLSAALPIEYDPEARAPRWESFLEEVSAGKEGWSSYLQALTGYGITGSTVEQLFVVHLGRGANGKSVFLDVLTEVFRPIVRTASFSTFEQKPAGSSTADLAALRDARLVMSSEGEAGRVMAEGVLKSLTGGEYVTARHLYQSQMEYRPRFLVQLATNHRPVFKGADEGIWRRVKLLPWDRYFEPHERDRRLAQLLQEREAEGILAWAVQGAVRWHREGLVEPPFITDAATDYRASSDELAGFLPGVLELAPGGVISGAEAYDLYLSWCDQEHVGRPWSKRALVNALEERGATKTADRMKRVMLSGVQKAPGEHACAGNAGELALFPDSSNPTPPRESSQETPQTPATPAHKRSILEPALLDGLTEGDLGC